MVVMASVGSRQQSSSYSSKALVFHDLFSPLTAEAGDTTARQFQCPSVIVLWLAAESYMPRGVNDSVAPGLSCTA